MSFEMLNISLHFYEFFWILHFRILELNSTRPSPILLVSDVSPDAFLPLHFNEGFSKVNHEVKLFSDSFISCLWSTFFWAYCHACADEDEAFRRIDFLNYSSAVTYLFDVIKKICCYSFFFFKENISVML